MMVGVSPLDLAIGPEDERVKSRFALARLETNLRLTLANIVPPETPFVCFLVRTYDLRAVPMFRQRFKAGNHVEQLFINRFLPETMKLEI